MIVILQNMLSGTLWTS